jgi:hypothetical protein
MRFDAVQSCGIYRGQTPQSVIISAASCWREVITPDTYSNLVLGDYVRQFLTHGHYGLLRQSTCIAFDWIYAYVHVHPHPHTHPHTLRNIYRQTNKQTNKHIPTHCLPRTTLHWEMSMRIKEIYWPQLVPTLHYLYGNGTEPERQSRVLVTALCMSGRLLHYLCIRGRVLHEWEAGSCVICV